MLRGRALRRAVAKIIVLTPVLGAILWASWVVPATGFSLLAFIVAVAAFTWAIEILTEG